MIKFLHILIVILIFVTISGCRKEKNGICDLYEGDIGLAPYIGAWAIGGFRDPEFGRTSLWDHYSDIGGWRPLSIWGINRSRWQ